MSFSSRMSYLFRVLGEAQSLLSFGSPLSPTPRQLSIPLLLPLTPCGLTKGKTILVASVWGLLGLVSTRWLCERWAIHVQNKVAILRKVTTCCLEKAQRTHIQSPPDQWKDAPQPNLLKCGAKRHSEAEAFDT